MNDEGFTFAQYESEKKLWFHRCPYAILHFISCAGQVTNSQLTNLLFRLGIEETSFGRQLVQVVVEALLRSGNIFKISDRAYAPFPRYTIQRNLSEWVILGDCTGDSILAQSGYHFEIRSNMDIDDIYIERLLLVESEESSAVLQLAGIRAYACEDLLALVPDVKLLVTPIPWPGFEPGAYAKWEIFDSNGKWTELQSRSHTPEGLCRGLAIDQHAQTRFVKYFFRHRDGWSPLTADEALLWALKSSATLGKPHSAEYLVISECLRLPVRIPYSAYVAVRFLGNIIESRDDSLSVEGIDFQTSSALCEKLGMILVMRRDQ